MSLYFDFYTFCVLLLYFLFFLDGAAIVVVNDGELGDGTNVENGGKVEENGKQLIFGQQLGHNGNHFGCAGESSTSLLEGLDLTVEQHHQSGKGHDLNGTGAVIDDDNVKETTVAESLLDRGSSPLGGLACVAGSLISRFTHFFSISFR